MVGREDLVVIVKDQLKELELLEGAVPREKLADAVGFSGSSALIAKGVRRCGKSTLLKQAMESKFKGNFYYFNFDDERIAGFLARDFQLLTEVFYEVFGERKAFLLDEIQNVKEWELFVNRLLRSGNKVFITGSNADLLSQELGTHLTGRHTDIELYPFSFREFLSAKNVRPNQRGAYSTPERAKMLGLFKNYLTAGGMPEAVVEGNEEVLRQILNDIIQKDIIRRHGIRKPNELRAVLQFLLANISNSITFRSISENFQIRSPNTVQKYAGYAEETYLLFMVKKFEKKIKLLEKSPNKVYCIDNGIAIRNSLNLGEQKGALLENLVAVELKRRGKRIFYYSNKNGTQTDFVVVESDGLKKEVSEAIQVCYDPSLKSTREREEKALIQTLAEQKKKSGLIITLDYEQKVTRGGKEISYLPAWKWLTTNLV